MVRIELLFCSLLLLAAPRGGVAISCTTAVRCPSGLFCDAGPSTPCPEANARCVNVEIDGNPNINVEAAITLTSGTPVPDIPSEITSLISQLEAPSLNEYRFQTCVNPANTADLQDILDYLIGKIVEPIISAYGYFTPPVIWIPTAGLTETMAQTCAEIAIPSGSAQPGGVSFRLNYPTGSSSFVQATVRFTFSWDAFTLKYASCNDGDGCTPTTTPCPTTTTTEPTTTTTTEPPTTSTEPPSSSVTDESSTASSASIEATNPSTASPNTGAPGSGVSSVNNAATAFLGTCALIARLG